MRRTLLDSSTRSLWPQISGGVSGEILINSKLSGVPEAAFDGSKSLLDLWKYAEFLH